MPRRSAAPPDRLDEYRAKRDFSVTSEPAGTAPPAENGQRFVVQRHRARRLHYDLRLEMGGVLVSWAVPKGPTLDPKARHLAVHVEDHPLDYYDFEGVIPAGEYGGGDVIVWDWGTWRPAKDGDPLAAVEKGDLHFDLDGEKISGRFVLVRRDGKNWILLHKRDESSVDGWDPESQPRSVKSGRTNDEVAADPDATWTSTGEQRHDRAAATWTPVTAEELAALDALGTKGTWTIGGNELRLTNLDKVLFPALDDAPAVTKRDLIRYHATIAPLILPYLAERPVNFLRFPDGVERKGFWQKAAPKHAPEWMRRWRNDEADPGETEFYLVLESPADLAWVANHAAIEINPWTSQIPDVHHPTWALIDIDPGESTNFEDVLVLARLYRTALEHLDVRAAPKVTGKRGVQIWVPIERGAYTFDDTRTWVEALSRAVGATVPELVSWKWEKSERGGKARLDYTQNAINKTLVAPFSARPAPGAPVSVPIRWEDLDDPELRPDRWTIRTVHDRVTETGDPLVELVGFDQRLPSL